MKLITCFALTLIIQLLATLAAPSVSAQVVINEVAPYLSTSSEWIELYNAGATPVNLGSWLLRDQLASPSDLKEFELDTILEPGGYLLVETINKLNNAADGLTLLTDTGVVVDQMTFTSSTPNQSWARVPDGSQTWVLTSPTKGLANPATLPLPTPSPLPSPSPTPSTSPTSGEAAPTPSPNASPSPTPSPSPSPTAPPSPQPSPEPTQWQPSEIMACPSSGNPEWLEIYNPDPVSYTFTNWLVRDSQGSLRSISFETPAFGFGVATWASGLLNNSGDSLSLLRPDQSVVFTIDLAACQSGQSWVLGVSGWEESPTPSLGTRNPTSQVPSPSPSFEPAIDLNETEFEASLPAANPALTITNPTTKPSGTLRTPKPYQPSVKGVSASSATASANPETITMLGPNLKTWPFLSVIMGGALILGAGIYDLEIAPLVQWLARLG